MKLGLQCGTLALAGMGFDDWVRVANDLGFKAMEIWMDWDNLWPFTTSKSDRKNALQILTSRGIVAPSVCPLPLKRGSWGKFDFEFNLAHPSDSLREKAIEFYRRAIDSAADFEAKTVLILPGKIEEPDLMKSPFSYRQHLERLVDSLKRLAPYAGDRGVTLGVEHAIIPNYMDLPWELRYVVESVGSDYVKVYFDTANANVFLPPIKYLDVVGDLLCNTIHMTDNKGDRVEHLPIGMGNIDFRSIIGRLKQIGWDGYIYPEIFYNEDPIGGLRTCKTALEKIINSI